MAVINEKIAELRKARGLTQEQLAEEIGISAQAISKWENSTNMPDIMLLPVIADIFDVTVDELYGKVRSTKHSFDETPKAAYLALLNAMGEAWAGAGDWDSAKTFADKVEKEFQNGAQTVICSDSGGAVYMNRDIGIVIREASRELFLNDDAGEILAALASPGVRRLLKYHAENPQGTYTLSSAAKKCGIDEKSAQEAIEFLTKHRFCEKAQLDLGGESVDIYQHIDSSRNCQLITILMMAENLSHNYIYNYGYRGAHGMLK